MLDIVSLRAELLSELASHFGEDERRIEHAMMVLGHAEALLARVPNADPVVVVAAAITHDFGIVEAERRHGKSTGTLQEKYGPDLVAPVLRRVGLGDEKVGEVCDIIASHHSPPLQPSVNFNLLYESDWLVNIHDFPVILADRKRLESFIVKNFHTDAGLRRAYELLLY
jgi:HD domain